MKRIAMAAFVSIFVLCGAAGCPPQPTPPTPDADSGPAPAPVDAGPMVDACARGEAQLLTLGCKDNRGRVIGGLTLKGVSWAQVCRNNAINGIDMHGDCIATKSTCAEVNACR